MSAVASDTSNVDFPTFLSNLLELCEKAHSLATSMDEGELKYEPLQIDENAWCVKVRFIPRGFNDKPEEWPPRFRLFAAGSFFDRRRRSFPMIRVERCPLLEDDEYPDTPAASNIQADPYTLLALISF